MTHNPDEELVYSRAFIESLDKRVSEAEYMAACSDERRAALEVLLAEARRVAVLKRNEYVNGDGDECGMDIDPLPWEVEPDAGVIDEVSRDVEVSGATWVVMEDEL